MPKKFAQFIFIDVNLIFPFSKNLVRKRLHPNFEVLIKVTTASNLNFPIIFHCFVSGVPWQTSARCHIASGRNIIRWRGVCWQ